MSEPYTTSLILITVGSLIIAAGSYWEKNYSERKRNKDRPLPFKPFFRLELFGYGILVVGIITLIMNLTGQL